MPEDTPLRRISRIALLIPLSIAGVCGCAQMKTSTTARTGAEQLLISNSVDQALNKVDWTSLRGKSVFIEEKYIDCVDKAYIIGSVRHRVATAGAKLAAAADKSDLVLEVRSGGVGTDISDAFVGIPAVSVPGFLTLPDIRFVTHQLETGTAKIGLIAYDAKTHKVLGDGGVSLAKSDNSNWYVFGTGPYQTGTIPKEVDRATTGAGQVPRTQVPDLVSFRSADEADPTPGGHVSNVSGTANPSESTIHQ
jgi:hypothetical protein